MMTAKRMLAMLVGAGIGSGILSSAQAQTPAGTPTAPVAVAVQKPFSVQIGVYFPSDSGLKEVGNTFISYGLGYDFLKTKANSPLIVSAFIDGVFPQSKTTSEPQEERPPADVKHTFSFIGLGPQVRTFFTPPTATLSFYGGIGVGPYFIHSEDKGGTAPDYSGKLNKTIFGAKFTLGVETAQGINGILNYTVLDSSDIKASGFGLSAGYRF